MEFKIGTTSNMFTEKEPPAKNSYPYRHKTHKNNYEWCIEINTLEDLLQLIEEVEEPIVIYENITDREKDKPKYTIEIYDTYRE